ncbi:Coenzyme F420 hydrogenase/dehydrogenase, beta subunit C-terminal domain [Enterovibrio norvegicus]|uniref:Coenzyme F420 hydrogenase/dehydrogenase, beta subunit C-terminal domain n=1 Tax=Enterovibrio norvegicus TaxID=188144 RepID=UPI0024B0C7A7|nr:Coenzyme F420 hydrogenase/dehydrogenase, beta subunit C-terminal domain [Enterovibrio norvegicus]
MGISKDGFLRPKEEILIDEISLVGCPGLTVSHDNGNSKYDPDWGAYNEIYTGRSTDENILRLGSSGGGITTLLIELLDKNLVDKIVQVGVSEGNPLLNETKISESPNEVIDCTGSRYSPSSPLDRIRELMKDGHTYAIVGKPCDISAVRALISANSKLNEKFPFLISFFCAGVPSINGTFELLDKLDVKKSDVVSFRYRGDGWPGLTKAVTIDKTEKTMTYNDSWGKVLNRHLQTRCKLCADGIGEAADIVCADAWHESDLSGYPSFKEAEGRSLFISRTIKGSELINSTVNSQRLSLDEYNIENLKKIQPYQAKRKRLAYFRHVAVKLSGGYVTKFNGYKLKRLAFRHFSFIALRDFLGTLKRVIRGSL